MFYGKALFGTLTGFVTDAVFKTEYMRALEKHTEAFAGLRNGLEVKWGPSIISMPGEH